MKKVKKILSLLLVFIFILSLSACKTDKDKGTEKKVNGKTVKASDITLPYSREDSVNPFKAVSLINRTIMPLMYESPVNLDEKFKPVPCIASDITVKDNTVIMDIAENKRFSDQTPVTGRDVVYSFNKAKESELYGTSLNGFTAAIAEGNNKVRFMMDKNNVFADADLTFPIVKSGTAEEGIDPIGSGKYIYRKTEGGGVLEMNTGSGWNGFHTKRIHLVNESASESLLYSLSIGNIDAVFDDISTGKLQRITASTVQVPLNNLVIIDINPKGVFEEPENRQAIDSVIDRTKLINNGMDGYGVESKYPCNPSWYVLKKKKSSKKDSEEAAEKLKKECRGRRYTILTNGDNEYKVKTAEALSLQLKSVGVETTVSALPYEEYSEAAKDGHYDFCIKEYKLTGDMDISFLIKEDEGKEMYEKVLSGKAPYEEFAKYYYGEMPFVTIGFRNGILAYTRHMKDGTKVLPGNPLSNVEKWQLV